MEAAQHHYRLCNTHRVLLNANGTCPQCIGAGKSFVLDANSYHLVRLETLFADWLGSIMYVPIEGPCPQ